MRATRTVLGLLVLLPLAWAAGCSEKLETGYDPRRLGASSEVRRGFYAAPFSPEARAAKEYQETFGDPGSQSKPGY